MHSTPDPNQHPTCRRKTTQPHTSTNKKINNQALGVCLGLHDAKNAMVRTAADMTVRQIISLLFDRVADELGVAAAAAAAAANNASGGGAAADQAAAAGDRGMEMSGEDREAGTAEEAVTEEEDEGGGGRVGEGALRCAHLVFQVKKRKLFVGRQDKLLAFGWWAS